MKLGVKHNPWLVQIISWSFFGHLFYFAGSFLWVIYPSMCWACDARNADLCPSYLNCTLIELAAAVCFVLNGFCSLFEVWSLDEYYESVGGYPRVFGGGYPRRACFSMVNFQTLNWFFVIHLSFFYGALSDTLVSLFDVFANGEYPEYSTAFDLMSSFFWLISGTSSLVYCLYDRYSRRNFNASLQYSLFTCCHRCTPKPRALRALSQASSLSSFLTSSNDGHSQHSIAFDSASTFSTYRENLASSPTSQKLLADDLDDGEVDDSFPSLVQRLQPKSSLSESRTRQMRNVMSSPHSSGVDDEVAHGKDEDEVPDDSEPNLLMHAAHVNESEYTDDNSRYATPWFDLFLISHIFYFVGTVCYVCGSAFCYITGGSGGQCWVWGTIAGGLFLCEWFLNALDYIRETMNEEVLELDEQECVNKILQRQRLLSVFEVPQYDGTDTTTATEDAMFDDEGILSPTGQNSPRERLLAEPAKPPQYHVAHEEGKMVVFLEPPDRQSAGAELSPRVHYAQHAQQLNQQLRVNLDTSGNSNRSSNTTIQ